MKIGSIMQANKTHMVKFALLALLANGCEEPDEDSQYTLSNALSNPITVTLNGEIGLLIAEVEKDAPKIPTEPVPHLKNLLVQGVISVIVKNNSTGVTHRLTEAALVEGTPIKQGQYTVHMSGDGSSASIEFFNSIGGNRILRSGSYSAVVSVQDNDYFAMETFVRNVAVE